MTPKEKAKELVDRFYTNIPLDNFKGTYSTFRNHAKQCALICVENEKKAVTDEIEKIAEYIPDDILAQMSIYRQKKYIELRQQIEKL